MNSIHRGHPDWSIVGYDRWHRGKSDDLPRNAEEHDLTTATADLDAFLHEVLKGGHSKWEIVLIGNSIGCSLARLLATGYAWNVKGIILLDSYMANSNFADCFPPRCTDEDSRLTAAREAVVAFLGPDVDSLEHLRRNNAASVLPSASEPKLPGDPVLIVASHDPVRNSELTACRLGIDAGALLEAFERKWHEYFEGLTELSGRSQELRAVEGASHFIQIDKSGEVVKMIEEVVEKITGA